MAARSSELTAEPTDDWPRNPQSTAEPVPEPTSTPSPRRHRREAIDSPLSTRLVPRAALPALLYGGAFLAKDLGALFDVHIPYVSDRAQGIAHGAHVGGTLV